MRILAALKGISGEFELGRVLGAGGGITYVVCPPVFQAWAIVKGQQWDPAAFCASYGGGFGLMIAGVAGAIALKERNIASAMAKRAEISPPAAGDSA